MGNRTSIKSLFAVALSCVGVCVLTSSCAVEDLGESTGEAAQACGNTEPVVAAFPCTNAGGTVAGTLTVNVTPNGTYCFRSAVIRSGDTTEVPPPDPDLPSCWGLAKKLGCQNF
jgi:hypothetical protein